MKLPKSPWLELSLMCGVVILLYTALMFIIKGAETPPGGMACLLFAAGFTKLSIGSEAEGVDEAIQMTEPEQLVILLSYTTGPNVGEKARKLNIQVERLQKRLQNYDVCAAVVIPLDEGELFVRDLEECKKENINLVLRSEIEQMFQAVRGIEWPRAREAFILLLTTMRLQLF